MLHLCKIHQPAINTQLENILVFQVLPRNFASFDTGGHLFSGSKHILTYSTPSSAVDNLHSS